MIERLYTVRELAEFSGMSQNRIRIWIVNRTLRVHTYSGIKQLIRRADFEEAAECERRAREQHFALPQVQHRQTTRSKTIAEIFAL
jgi:hypothetical protein